MAGRNKEEAGKGWLTLAVAAVATGFLAAAGILSFLRRRKNKGSGYISDEENLAEPGAGWDSLSDVAFGHAARRLLFQFASIPHSLSPSEASLALAGTEGAAFHYTSSSTPPPLPMKEFTFTNHGSYGAVPRVVADEHRRLMALIENSPDGWFRHHSYAACREAMTQLAEALFPGVDPEDCVNVLNATTALNTVTHALVTDLEPGDGILMFDITYGAVKNALHHLARLSGATIVEVPLPLPLVDPAKELLAPVARVLGVPFSCAPAEHVALPAEAPRSVKRFRLAVFDHISSSTGLLLPVAELAALCQQYNKQRQQQAQQAQARGGADEKARCEGEGEGKRNPTGISRELLVFVDGAHAAGQVPVPLAALAGAGVDFYTTNLHKWLFAPKGSALLFAAKKHQGWLHPLCISHEWQSPSFARRFWMQGTRDESATVIAGRRVARAGGVRGALAFYEAIDGKQQQQQQQQQQQEQKAAAAAHGNEQAQQKPQESCLAHGGGRVRTYCWNLCRSAAAFLAREWGVATHAECFLYPSDMHANMVVVRTPISDKAAAPAPAPAPAPATADKPDAAASSSSSSSSFSAPASVPAPAPSPVAVAVHAHGGSALATKVMDALFTQYHVVLPVLSFNGHLYARISAQVYNAPEDYAAVAESVKALAHALKHGAL